MTKRLNYKIIWMLLSALLGLLYYFLIQVNLVNIEHKHKSSSAFSFVLDSHINQNVKLHIGAQNYKLLLVKSDETTVKFPKKKMQWFEGVGEQVEFSLQKGKNHFSVQVNNRGRFFTPVVKQKISSFDYGILFILLGLPIFHLIFTLFIFLLNKIKYKPAPLETLENTKSEKVAYLLLGIMFLGILIRVIYFHKFGVMQFQHDWHGHVEFIKYIANNFTLPLSSKGLEYPQQPLYYLITGALYALFTNLGFNEANTIFALGYISLTSSLVFIYYSYRLMRLLTQETWIRTVAMIFISLTPSLVYMSARINNDSLVMALAVLSLYYIVKSYKQDFQRGFYKALLGVSLLFMTKISAAPMELFFFALLVLTYLREKQLQKNLYIFSLVGVFLLGFTLLRVYLPIEESFHMVNSSANYPRQTIEHMGFSYFFAFHIKSLLEVAYSYVYGLDDIRYSFLTYQYGTMLFGEFNYTYYLEKYNYLKIFMQGVILFSLVYVFGFISYVLKLYKRDTLEIALFGLIALNLLLILKFMISYPAICNTDFRYFVPSFAIFAFIFAKGLFYLHQFKFLAYVLNTLVSLLAISQLLFFSVLLR